MLSTLEPKVATSGSGLDIETPAKLSNHFLCVFSTNIAVYLGNGTRWAYYHGSITGTRRYLIDPCHFGWPWVTLKGKLVTILFRCAINLPLNFSTCCLLRRRRAVCCEWSRSYTELTHLAGSLYTTPAGRGYAVIALYWVPF